MVSLILMNTSVALYGSGVQKSRHGDERANCQASNGRKEHFAYQSVRTTKLTSSGRFRISVSRMVLSQLRRHKDDDYGKLASSFGYQQSIHMITTTSLICQSTDYRSNER